MVNPSSVWAVLLRPQSMKPAGLPSLAPSSLRPLRLPWPLLVLLFFALRLCNNLGPSLFLFPPFSCDSSVGSWTQLKQHKIKIINENKKSILFRASRTCPRAKVELLMLPSAFPGTLRSSSNHFHVQRKPALHPRETLW